MMMMLLHHRRRRLGLGKPSLHINNMVNVILILAVCCCCCCCSIMPTVTALGYLKRSRCLQPSRGTRISCSRSSSMDICIHTVSCLSVRGGTRNSGSSCNSDDRASALGLPNTTTNAALHVAAVALTSTRGGSTHAGQSSRQQRPLPADVAPSSSSSSSNSLKSARLAPSSSVVTTSSSLRPTEQQQQQQQQQRRQQYQRVLLGTAATSAAYFAYTQRALWLPFLTNKQAIQGRTLELLQGLQRPDGSVSAQSLATYCAAMAVWEFFGLTTIPVETAAAMVFGWTALAVSLAGKMLGALTAFTVGRFWLADTVRAKLMKSSSKSGTEKSSTSSSPWQVLWASPEESNASSTGSHTNNTADTVTTISPLQTALLMKFSCFPEAMKNFGCSLLLPVKLWMFVLATAVHGGFYTALWTWLGVDTAARLQHTAAASSSISKNLVLPLPANVPLNVTLVFAGVIGIVVSPLLMAWWLRTLKRQADALTV
jgi:uncharacterized membrane protein YdjX (TVP38/TMEM64 family)